MPSDLNTANRKGTSLQVDEDGVTTGEDAGLAVDSPIMMLHVMIDYLALIFDIIQKKIWIEAMTCNETTLTTTKKHPQGQQQQAQHDESI